MRENMNTQKTFDNLQENTQVQRKPCGYFCQVIKIDKKLQKVKIKDLHHSRTFWVSKKTFNSSWQ